MNKCSWQTVNLQLFFLNKNIHRKSVFILHSFFLSVGGDITSAMCYLGAFDFYACIGHLKIN